MRSALPLALLLAASALAAPTWVTVQNARFGFRVDIPTHLVRAEPEPDNGDGRIWRTPDGQVEIRAYASYGPGVLDRTTVKANLTADRRDAEAGGLRVTYAHQGASFYVLSGFLPGDRILYRKTFIQDGTATTVHIEYPRARRATWDALTARIARSLTPAVR